jgi:hypothetical protein
MGSRMAAVAVAVWCVMGEVMAHPVETLRRVGPDEERGEIPAWIVITAIAVVMALAAGGIIFSAVQRTANNVSTNISTGQGGYGPASGGFAG